MYMQVKNSNEKESFFFLYIILSNSIIANRTYTTAKLIVNFMQIIQQ